MYMQNFKTFTRRVRISVLYDYNIFLYVKEVLSHYINSLYQRDKPSWIPTQ